ncbi:kinase-like protein [Xylaria intraflava]|nr:kinase-like protein [Xylaria intraflava]
MSPSDGDAPSQSSLQAPPSSSRNENEAPVAPEAPMKGEPSVPYAFPRDCSTITSTWGCEVQAWDGDILKKGDRVTRNEEAALRLVKEHTNIPVPAVFKSDYKTTARGHPWGYIWMERLRGTPLHKLWDGLEAPTKAHICRQLWGFVDQLRKIPRPAEFEHLYQCGADGSLCQDVMLKDLNSDAPMPILDDQAFRNRINERYLFYAGGTYGEHLPDFLPRADSSVFTHTDLAPPNILVDESYTIVGLLDWESAGWFPDYWEYAKLHSQVKFEDFMGWMDRTRPQDWDITGIKKAARVLF